MTLANYDISLNFEQILALVKQLPYPEKLQLSHSRKVSIKQ